MRPEELQEWVGNILEHYEGRIAELESVVKRLRELVGTVNNSRYFDKQIDDTDDIREGLNNLFMSIASMADAFNQDEDYDDDSSYWQHFFYWLVFDIYDKMKDKDEDDEGLGYGATPSTQAFGDAAAAGATNQPERAGHKHGMPANPVPSVFTNHAGKSLRANSVESAYEFYAPTTVSVYEAYVDRSPSTDLSVYYTNSIYSRFVLVTVDLPVTTTTKWAEAWIASSGTPSTLLAKVSLVTASQGNRNAIVVLPFIVPRNWTYGIKIGAAGAAPTILHWIEIDI